MPRSALAMPLLLVLCFSAAAQDSDKDGIPDAVETALGSDPDRAEEFQLILDDKSKADGDKTLGSKFKAAPDVTQAALANVARDRWLLRIEFSKPYVRVPNTFILYLDVDGDLTTGRQDKAANRGTDLMYVQQDGRFSLVEHTKGLRTGPLRMEVVDRAIYICDDVKFAERGGRAKVRFNVLSHVSPPNASDADHSDWRVVTAPAARDADKPRIGPPPPLAPRAKLTTDKPDADRDGVPDETELVLGTSPTVPEEFFLIKDDKAQGQGDKDIRKLKIAPDITKVYFANVAGNRYVWRIDFAKDFVSQGTVLIFYLDCDNRLDTGRQDGALGTDVMLTCVHGRFRASIRNAAVTTLDRAERGAIDGNVVYFSMDLRLRQNKEGRSEYRGMVLSHRLPETSDADITNWFVIHGPGESDRPKPRAGILSEFRSTGFLVERPWLGWRRDLRLAQTVTIEPSACEVTGFERKDRAFVGKGDSGHVRFQTPRSGRWHVGLVVADDRTATEHIEVRAGRQAVGTAVVAQNDGELYIFVTRNAVQLDAGARVELAATQLTRESKISEIFLAAKPPRPRGLEIADLATYCPRQRGARVDVHVCWTTNWPCSGAARWGEGSSLDQTVMQEDQAGHNHRVILRGLERGKRYCVQAVAGEGKEACKSEVVQFVAQPRRAAKGHARRERVPLRVAEPTTAARPLWPVSSGVPIPPSALASASQCRLLDRAGRPVPAGFHELSHWPDGSVKWLLVSAVTALAKREEATYTLEYGEDVATPQIEKPVRVERAGGGLRITNGPLQVTLSEAKFAPPGRVLYDRNSDGVFQADELVFPGTGKGVVLRDEDGRELTTSGARCTRLEVEEEGAVRTVILAEGDFAGRKGNRLFRYRCRLYFYRGFPGLPLVFTLINNEGTKTMPPTLTRITSLSWPLRPMLGSIRTVHGPTGEHKDVDVPLRVLQDYDTRTVIAVGTDRRESDLRPVGSAGLAGDRGSFSVGLRYFWQTYPKAMSFERGAVTAELLPELPEGQYAEHSTIAERTQRYFWCDAGKYRLPRGAAISHDVLAYFGDEPASEVGQWWEHEPFLAASPEHYCKSKALMDISPERADVFPSWAAFVGKGLERQAGFRERQREYDFFSFGDWYGERRYNWGNLEYDMAWGLLVHFARTADLRFLARATEASRHMAAIDVINDAANPYNLGRVHVHCLAHTGGYHPKRIEGAKYWYNHGGHDVGHTWTQGMYMTYCLTGDRRYLDSAELVAAWLAAHYTPAFYRSVHRNYGWATIAVLAGYQTTANPHYLNAARLFTEYTLAKQDPGTGRWAHPIGECTHTPKCMGGKAFMTGVGLTGLKMMDQIKPDVDVKRAIVRGCDWLHHRMWHTWDNSFQYAECSNFDKSSTHAGTFMLCEGLAYAYDLANKPEFKQMLLRSLGDMIRRGPYASGKGYSMQIRMVPYALHTMEGWGEKRVPLPPPPAPVVEFGGPVTLAPEGAAFAAIVHNRGHQPVAAVVKVTGLSDGLSVRPTQVEWQARPGRGFGPAFRVEGTLNKPSGEIKIAYQAGKTHGRATVPCRALADMPIGKEVGYVGGEGDPLGRALRAMKIDLPALSDVRADALSRFAALVIGCEAHHKNFAHLKDAPWRLIDFVHAGGVVGIVQLQDSSCQMQYLPYPLELSNDSSSFGAITAGAHPVFARPHQIKSLAGVVSYDTIVRADPAWRVLAKDQKGQPSVLECAFGKGRILLVLPSPDRYVCGETQPEGTLSVEECRRFLGNVVAYMRP